jgi:TorA maturation chaperone TorD
MAENLPAELEDKGVLLKKAADALDLAKLRDDATKLAFALVEKGKVPPYESYEELQDKVASLMGKDLRVVQEALELDVALPDFGKVASDAELPDDATAAFFHRLAED